MSDRPARESGEPGEAVLAIFQRGAEFTRQLLDENARLRRELSSIHTRDHEAAQSDEEWSKLRAELTSRIDALENEKSSILEQLEESERENQQFARHYLEVEEQNNNLANLYVASFQLHATLDPGEVVQTIVEITINLIGSEVFAVYVHEDASDRLRPVAAEGDDLANFPRVRAGEGFVGESVESGEVRLRDPVETPKPPGRGGEPLVAIPLRLDDQPIGAVVIYKMLEQKDSFTALDRELFDLLAGQAATAICASRLYARTERKLSTAKGFIDLLTR